LPAESSGFLRSLHNKRRSDRHGIKTVNGEIDDHAIEVFHTGVGEKVCRQQMRKFLQDRQFDCLISAGFAGALNDQLHVGDLLLAKNFSTIELTEARSSLSNLPIHTADLFTVSSMIESGEERIKIAQATRAAAVDMETEFIARACAERAIPLLSLRVISDAPRDPFPAPAKVLFDIEQQRTSIISLGSHLLKHPSAIPRLITFSRKIAQGREILANAIVSILQSDQL
jgi:nucleoside phosphorylase